LHFFNGICATSFKNLMSWVISGVRVSIYFLPKPQVFVVGRSHDALRQREDIWSRTGFQFTRPSIAFAYFSRLFPENCNTGWVRMEFEHRFDKICFFYLRISMASLQSIFWQALKECFSCYLKHSTFGIFGSETGVRYGKIKIFLWANLALFDHDGGSKYKKIWVVFCFKTFVPIVFGSLQFFGDFCVPPKRLFHPICRSLRTAFEWRCWGAVKIMGFSSQSELATRVIYARKFKRDAEKLT